MEGTTMVATKLLRTAAALTAAVLVALTVSVTGAGAAPPEHARAAAAVTDVQRAAVEAYWTDARMAAAIPADVLLADREPPRRGAVETGAPSSVAPVHHRPDHAGGPGGNGGGGGDGTVTVTGATWDQDGLVADTTGKLFFTLDGTNYVCSGSVVAANNDRTVLTAGHCIHEGTGGDEGFADNVAFVPAYAGSGTDQVGPHGVWTASELATTTQWATSGDLNYDVGFIRVNDEGGVTITDAVGGAQGIAFNHGVGSHVYAFGYPHASPYDGTTLTYCAGTTVSDRFSPNMGLTCDMTGGSSGGPWYLGFQDGAGEAISVNSYRYTRGRDRDKMFGPTFGTVVQSLYNDAQG